MTRTAVTLPITRSKDRTLVTLPITRSKDRSDSPHEREVRDVADLLASEDSEICLVFLPKREILIMSDVERRWDGNGGW